MKFVNFVNRNTIMDSFVLSAVKFLLIIIPLFIGLYSYPYLEIDFCKALILYSVPLAFDMGVRIEKHLRSNVDDVFLLAVVMILFVFSAILIVVGFIGVFNNPLFVQKMGFIVNNSWIVYVCIFSQSAWYFIEAVAFLVVTIIIKKHPKKTPVKITTDSKIENNI